jgi:hypothetical protein
MIEDTIKGTIIILRALRKRVPIYSKIEIYEMPRKFDTVPFNESNLTSEPIIAAKVMAIRICQCKDSFFI